jgi:hypothetical protein
MVSDTGGGTADRGDLGCLEVAPTRFLRRWTEVLLRVERQGLRGQNAEAVAALLLTSGDHPEILRPVRRRDIRCEVRNSRRGEDRRAATQREAALSRVRLPRALRPPGRLERREARRVLAALLREGERTIRPRDLGDFARRLLEAMPSDPDYLPDRRHRRGDAVRATFAGLLARRGVEVPDLAAEPRCERILLRALRSWASRAPGHPGSRDARHDRPPGPGPGGPQIHGGRRILPSWMLRGHGGPGKRRTPMRGTLALVVVFVLALASIALAGAKAAGGTYGVTGYVNGSATVAEGGGAGSMNTTEFDMDVFIWDALNAEYLVYDGASGLFVGEFILTVPQGPPPPKYFAQYYDSMGTPMGTGNWN